MTSLMRGAFDRTVKTMTGAAMPAHGQRGGTERTPLVIDGLSRAGGSRMLAGARIEGDDRADVLGVQIVINAPGIVTGA